MLSEGQKFLDHVWAGRGGVDGNGKQGEVGWGRGRGREGLVRGREV